MRLLRYTAEHKLRVYGFELGNEPDLYPTHANATVSPSQLAQDFAHLRSLLDSVLPTAKLFGPDVATVEHSFLADFINASGAASVDSVTWHFYYGSGHTAHVSGTNRPQLSASTTADT